MQEPTHKFCCIAERTKRLCVVTLSIRPAAANQGAVLKGNTMSAAAAHTLQPPSKTLMFLEARALHEFGAFLGALPLLTLAPTGDGHPVLVLPGLVASDTSTRPLRAFLRSRGYFVK